MGLPEKGCMRDVDEINVLRVKNAPSWEVKSADAYYTDADSSRIVYSQLQGAAQQKDPQL